MADLDIPYYRPVSRPRISAPQVEAISARALNPQPLRNAVFDLLNVFGERVAENRASKFRVAVGQASLDLRRATFELAKDGDPASRPERFQKVKEELLNRYQERLDKDGIGGADEFAHEFERTALAEEFDLTQASYRELHEQQGADLEMSLDNYSKLAGEGRPEQTQQFRDMGVLAIEDAERAGIISPMEAVKRRRQFVSDVVETRVRRDIMADPHAAEMALLNGQYEDLDPDERMDLVGKATAGVDRQERALEREENRAWQAQTRQWRVEDRATAAEDRRQRLLDRASNAAEAEERRRVAAEDRGYRLMERGERDLADKIQKEGDRLAATGELTPSWIEKNRDNLDPEDYRHFYKQLEPETANLTTDPGIYASLRLRVAAGEDIRQDARIFMHHGDLAISEFDKLINEWESRAGGGASQRPGWAGQGETFIKNSLKVSDINPDPGAPQRLAQVLDQWSDWERANPGAKYEEAQKVYRDLVSNAAVVNFQQVLSQTSAPTAAAIKTPTDLKAAEQRLVDEFSAKYGDDTTALMNDAEFLRRAEELEKLHNSMPQTAGTEE